MGRGLKPSKVEWWNCLRKARFVSFPDARRVVVKMRAEGKRVTPYRCVHHCGGWHIGNVPSMETVERIARDIRERHNGPLRDFDAA